MGYLHTQASGAKLLARADEVIDGQCILLQCRSPVLARTGGSLRCSKSSGHEGEAEILLLMPLDVPDLAAEQ
jgi:hypothetical protein